MATVWVYKIDEMSVQDVEHKNLTKLVLNVESTNFTIRDGVIAVQDKKTKLFHYYPIQRYRMTSTESVWYRGTGRGHG